MKTDENLIARKIPYQPVSDGDVGIPKTELGKGMPTPTDVKMAVRKLKKGDWSAGEIYTLGAKDGVDDQSVYVMFHPAEDADALLQPPHKTAPIIVKFTPGKNPVWSHYVGKDAPLYEFFNETVDNILISWSNPENNPTEIVKMSILFSGGNKSIEIEKKGDKYQLKSGMKMVEGQELGDFGGEYSAYETCIEYSPAPQGDTLNGCGVEEDDNFFENFEKIYSDGGAVYYFKPEIDVYASPDMYVGTKQEDEYLLPPEVDFDNFSALVVMKRLFLNWLWKIQPLPPITTGRNSSEPSSLLVEEIMFPGDEGLLAPIGTDGSGNTVNCGENLPEGRALKSITPAFDSGEIVSVVLEFRDGSRCVFPDEETREFMAIDKETGQMLKGVVQKEGFYKYQGTPRQKYEEIKENRRMRNLNAEFNIIVEDDNLTRALAWYGDESGTILEIMVPDPDNPSKSILITIPMMEA